MKKGFIFVVTKGAYSSLWQTLFYDFIESQDVKIVEEQTDTRKLAVWLKKNKIQRLTKGKLNFYITSNFALYSVLESMSSDYERIYVVFLNASFTVTCMPSGVLDTYRQKWPNLRYVLFYVDSVGRGVSFHADRLRQSGNVFDLVYTFDSADARKYNMRYWHTIYSKFALDVHPDKDLFFCGSTVNRKQTMLDFLDAHAKHDVSLKMNIICDETDIKMFSNYGDVTECGRMGIDLWPYPQTLEETLKARCILDITQKGQAGLTLRPYEAVCYNRKLLTNNKAILDFEFYDPRFMQYFEKVEDIDWDWVKEDIKVDYHYNGEFSPLRLLEDIVKSCEE